MDVNQFLQQAEALAEDEKRKSIVRELRKVDDAKFQIAVNVLEAEARHNEIGGVAWDKMAAGLLYLKQQDEQQQGAA